MESNLHSSWKEESCAPCPTRHCKCEHVNCGNRTTIRRLLQVLHKTTTSDKPVSLPAHQQQKKMVDSTSKNNIKPKERKVGGNTNNHKKSERVCVGDSEGGLVYVFNLPRNFTKEDVLQLFSGYHVVYVTKVWSKDKSGHAACMVRLKCLEEVQKALKMDGKVVERTSIRVQDRTDRMKSLAEEAAKHRKSLADSQKTSSTELYNNANGHADRKLSVSSVSTSATESSDDASIYYGMPFCFIPVSSDVADGRPALMYIPPTSQLVSSYQSRRDSDGTMSSSSSSETSKNKHGCLPTPPAKLRLI